MTGDHTTSNIGIQSTIKISDERLLTVKKDNYFLLAVGDMWKKFYWPALLLLDIQHNTKKLLQTSFIYVEFCSRIV